MARERVPFVDTSDWIATEDVCREWQVIRYSQVAVVAEAHGVGRGTRSLYLTTGTNESPIYNPVDVRRVARAIADGTIAIDPAWRVDTPEGREAAADEARRRERGRRRGRVVIAAVLLLLAAATITAIVLSATA